MHTVCDTNSEFLNKIGSTIEFYAGMDNQQLLQSFDFQSDNDYPFFRPMNEEVDYADQLATLMSELNFSTAHPNIQNPVSNLMIAKLQSKLAVIIFNQESTQLALRELFDEFMVYFTGLIKSPYIMHGSEHFNKCEHFELFNKIHIRTQKSEVLPAISMEVNGSLIDYTAAPQNILGSFPVYRKSHAMDISGGEGIFRLGFFLFMQEKFKDHPCLKYAQLLFPHIHKFFYRHVPSHFHPKFTFYLSRVLSTLKIIFLRRKSVEFYKIYRGMSMVMLDQHLQNCHYIKKHSDALLRWHQSDERMYNFLISQGVDPNNFAYFSPEALKREYLLHDKKSARALLKTNNTLFGSIITAMHTKRNANGCRFLLHWMAYSRVEKFNTYCVLGLMFRLNNFQILSDSLLCEYPNESVKLIDLLYERTLQLWDKFKCQSAEFYKAILCDQQIDKIFEYLSVASAENFDDDLDAEYMVIVNLSSINQKTTLASIDRKIEEMHKDALNMDIESFEYPHEFRVTEINGFTFTAIKNSDELIEERDLMQHCIAKYNAFMGRGVYVAFRITGNNQRATLGVHVIPSSNDKICFYFRLDQCQGPFNNPVSSAISAAVEKFMFRIHSLHEKLDGNALPFID